MKDAKLPGEPDRECRYCQRAMRVSAEAYRENPFCRYCLHERMEAARSALGPSQLVLVGDHAVVISAPQVVVSVRVRESVFPVFPIFRSRSGRSVSMESHGPSGPRGS